MAGNDVRINVTAQTKEAEDGLKRVQKRFEQTDKDTKGLTGRMQGLTKSFALFGIGTLSVGLAINTLITASGEAAQASASLRAEYRKIPPGLQNAFDKAKPHFKDLGKEFGFLEDDVAAAMLALLTESRNAAVGVGELEGALGRAATNGSDAEGSAKLLGKAIAGDLGAIKEYTGYFTSIAEATKIYAEEGPDAITFVDNWKLAWKELFRDVGSGLNTMAEQVQAAKNLINAGFGKVEAIGDPMTRNEYYGLLADERGGDPRQQGKRDEERRRWARGMVIPPGLLDPGSKLLPPGLRYGRPGPWGPGVPMAAGGIVSKPTLAMIGESGPEAVVPLSGAGGGLGGITINIQGDVVVDDEVRMGKWVDAIERRLTDNAGRGVGI